MRLTKREKVLLAILIFLVAFFGSFRFIVVDQQVAIREAENELAFLQSEIERLEIIESIIDDLDQQIELVEEDQDVIKAQFFSLVEEQEEIILLLNEFLMSPDVRATSLSFNPPSTETIVENDEATGENAETIVENDEATGEVTELDLVSLGVTLNYESSYFSLMNLMRSFWQFDRKILVNQLNMNAAPEGRLTGSLQLNLYDLAHLTEDIDHLFMWIRDVEAVKSNPFSQAAPSQAFQIRYVFRDSETAILAQQPYIPFEDIEGHWAEDAIHALGEKGLFPPSGTLNFVPDEVITRGEFIILLDRLYDWPIPDQPLDLTDFDDYEAIGSYSSAVSRAIFSGYLRGYIVGYADNTLRPNDPISYEEVEFVMRKVLEDQDFNWPDAAQSIQEETGFESPGIDNIRESLNRAEAVYFLYLLEESQ